MLGIEVSSPSEPADPAQWPLSDLGVEWHADDSEVLGFIHQDERMVLSEVGGERHGERSSKAHPFFWRLNYSGGGGNVFAGRHLASRLIKNERLG